MILVANLNRLALTGLFALMATTCWGQHPASLDALAKEPIKYVGTVQPDKYFYDGRLLHAVGVHHTQVFRANRGHPSEGGESGWTYNHQPYLAYWQGRFYLQFLSGQFEEHAPPTRILLVTSEDGRSWTKPVVAFPEYELPEIKRGDIHVPAGTRSVMHQRMGFYVAPNGRLLVSGFYSYCPTPRHSPNTGNGLGRVVREIYDDGTLGPVYFIRYNRHAGFDETNTSFPFYKESPEAGFVSACEKLLADKLITLQWWEEDRGEDGFFAIDPSQVKDEDPNASKAGVTTSAGAGKAFCFFRRSDGVVVGLWKNQYSAVSPDEGKSWTPIVKNTSLLTCGAKTWAQRTEDDGFALVHDQSPTRRNRFPLVVMPSKDGHEFDDIMCVLGEVPPQRYQGIHKNRGPQYVRGILEGNGDPPGDEMWLTYSMNKEDIWVSRVRVPISGKVSDHVEQTFDALENESDLVLWNLYMPQWATIKIVERDDGGKCLQFLDEDPYDYAWAERILPPSQVLTVAFGIQLETVARGHALEVEVQDAHGTRPMRLRFDANWLGLDREKVFPLSPVAIQTGRWYDLKLQLNTKTQSYDVALDGQWVHRNVAFAHRVETLERVVFRTGPYRGDVLPSIAETGEPRPAGLYSEDLPGGDEKSPTCRYLIDNVKTSSQR